VPGAPETVTRIAGLLEHARAGGLLGARLTTAAGVKLRS